MNTTTSSSAISSPPERSAYTVGTRLLAQLEQKINMDADPAAIEQLARAYKHLSETWRTRT